MTAPIKTWAVGHFTVVIYPDGSSRVINAKGIAVGLFRRDPEGVEAQREAEDRIRTGR